MSSQPTPKLYIAGIGMITPVGFDTTSTAAAVRAGVSGYQASSYYTKKGQPITMAAVPEEVFRSEKFKINEGDRYGDLYDHVIKMAILALREAVAGQTIKNSVPLLLALPEEVPGVEHTPPKLLIENLLNQSDLPLRKDAVRCIATGRAAGIEALDWAFSHLYAKGEDFVLLGGSDCHQDYPRLRALEANQRVLAPNVMDGFAPGEGAGFLLLTRHRDRAMSRVNHIIGLCHPGRGDEPGHFSSEEAYRGDGLDEAFKKALYDYSGDGIHAIYSSLNGENFWAKEYGVATLRNKSFFQDNVKMKHPADCLGDLGAATAPVLMGLAAYNLLNEPGVSTHLVYSSSDGAARAAVRVEKLPRMANL